MLSSVIVISTIILTLVLVSVEFYESWNTVQELSKYDN